MSKALANETKTTLFVSEDFVLTAKIFLNKVAITTPLANNPASIGGSENE